MAVTWNRQVLKDIKEATYRGVINGTEGVKTNSVEKIQSGEKTGRIYRRRGVEHQASAPGEAPASDTGRLVQSITTDYNFGPIQGNVNFGTEYAALLEFGTVRMEPRPYARNSLNEETGNIIQEIVTEIQFVLD